MSRDLEKACQKNSEHHDARNLQSLREISFFISFFHSTPFEGAGRAGAAGQRAELHEPGREQREREAPDAACKKKEHMGVFSWLLNH